MSHPIVRRRRLVAGALPLVLAATLGLSACSAKSNAAKDAAATGQPVAASSGEQIKIAFVSGPLNDPFFPPLYQGAQDAAKQLPIKLNYIPIDEADIQASSARTMEAAIASKPDAIVVGDFITNVVDPLIKKAVAAGIPVFVNQSGQDSWEKDGALGFIGQFGPDVGAQSAKRFLDAGKKNITCVVNVAGNPYLDAICKGLGDGLRAAGGSSDVFTLPSGDGTDQSKTTKDLSGFLATHKDVEGVMTLNNLTGYAAIDALNQAGRKGAPVGSLGVGKSAIDKVNNGSMLFLVNEQPYLDGYLGTITAYTYAKFGLAPVGVIKTGPQFVDKSNVEKISAVFDKYPNVIGPK
ncbi:simple sugar transport system substrate-binding protein [Motilibacter peucedani]|uniref:Simple sugar transport system substrate-binding protein n=1 Tax=Motilibacter peucedani TaxID=598650 RepID=A0A420XQK7_9ACTN|nr:substrate-binding domain-containing protein [Motilibacter peucedani]RKS75535.1 simple sugar transport system substrate-binding protein [Motilibacter peucedani]